MSVASSFPCSLSANSTSSEGLAPLPLSTSVGSCRSVRSPSRSPSESNTTGSSVGALERSDRTERSSSEDPAPGGTVVKARSSPLWRKACTPLALLAMISSGHLSGAKAAFRSDVPVCTTRANMAVNRSSRSPRLLLRTSLPEDSSEIPRAGGNPSHKLFGSIPHYSTWYRPVPFLYYRVVKSMLCPRQVMSVIQDGWITDSKRVEQRTPARVLDALTLCQSTPPLP